MREALLEKIRLCDVALTRLPPDVQFDHNQFRRAIQDVRTDTVARLRAFGYDVDGEAA